MSPLVADLAFAGADESGDLDSAKVGILAASVIADGVGWLVVRRVTDSVVSQSPIGEEGDLVEDNGMRRAPA